MTRPLDTFTLDNAAKQYAAWFMADAGKFDRAWVMKQFYNFTFKDEFEFIRDKVRGMLAGDPLAAFEAELAKLDPRSDAVFAALLEQKRPAGYTPKEA